VSESAPESGDDGGELGLAALIGADIVETDESASDFEPSDEDPADSSDDESASSGGMGPPEKDIESDGDGSDQEDQDVEVNSDASYCSSKEQNNDQMNGCENESSDSGDNEGNGNQQGRKKRKLGISDGESAHNNNDESSECAE